MKKIFLNLLILFLLGCSGKKEAEYCTPINSVELLINYPEPILSKLQIDYYDIYNEDENFVYFGRWRLGASMDKKLNVSLEREMRPFYKTDKKEFYEIYDKTLTIAPRKIDSVIGNWFLTKYDQYKNDTIKSFPRSKIKLTESYDAYCTGSIEFYYSKMEKTRENVTEQKIYTIKKFNYEALIEEGVNIKWLKESEEKIKL